MKEIVLVNELLINLQKHPFDDFCVQKANNAYEDLEKQREFLNKKVHAFNEKIDEIKKIRKKSEDFRRFFTTNLNRFINNDKIEKVFSNTNPPEKTLSIWTPEFFKKACEISWEKANVGGKKVFHPLDLKKKGEGIILFALLPFWILVVLGVGFILSQVGAAPFWVIGTFASKIPNMHWIFQALYLVFSCLVPIALVGLALFALFSEGEWLFCLGSIALAVGLFWVLHIPASSWFWVSENVREFSFTLLGWSKYSVLFLPLLFLIPRHANKCRHNFRLLLDLTEEYEQKEIWNRVLKSAGTSKEDFIKRIQNPDEFYNWLIESIELAEIKNQIKDDETIVSKESEEFDNKKLFYFEKCERISALRKGWETLDLDQRRILWKAYREEIQHNKKMEVLEVEQDAYQEMKRESQNRQRQDEALYRQKSYQMQQEHFENQRIASAQLEAIRDQRNVYAAQMKSISSTEAMLREGIKRQNLGSNTGRQQPLEIIQRCKYCGGKMGPGGGFCALSPINLHVSGS